MSQHRIHIFVSHSWAYSKHYDRLASWIFGSSHRRGQAVISCRDYSVPRDDPIHNAPSERKLKEAIYRKIARSHVVVIPTGMYVSYSRWIQKEIDGALALEKPILAVVPWRQKRKPSELVEIADNVVNWRRQSVVKAIWSLYRNG